MLAVNFIHMLAGTVLMLVGDRNKLNYMISCKPTNSDKRMYRSSLFVTLRIFVSSVYQGLST